MRALELKLDRKLSTRELMRVFDEWYRPSEAFIPAADTREEHLAGFLVELEKVCVPTGQGATNEGVGERLKAVTR